MNAPMRRLIGAFRSASERLREAFAPPPDGWDTVEGHAILHGLLIEERPTDVFARVHTPRHAAPGATAQAADYEPKHDGSREPAPADFLLTYPALYAAGHGRSLAVWRESVASAPWGFLIDWTATDDPR